MQGVILDMLGEERPLTEREARFVAAYLRCFNARRAAEEAGLADTQVRPYRLIKQPHIRAAIERALRTEKKATEALRERIIEELAAIAFSDASEIYEEDGSVKPWSKTDGRLIAEIMPARGKKKGKLYDKLRALELLGKHLGMWLDRQDISGGKIEVVFRSPRRVEAAGGPENRVQDVDHSEAEKDGPEGPKSEGG